MANREMRGLRLEGIHMALLGMRTSTQHNCITLYNNNYNNCIIVRGRFRVGVGVVLFQPCSNTQTMYFSIEPEGLD